MVRIWWHDELPFKKSPLLNIDPPVMRTPLLQGNSNNYLRHAVQRHAIVLHNSYKGETIKTSPSTPSDRPLRYDQSF